VLWRGRRFSLVTYGAFVALGAAVMALWSGACVIALGVAPASFASFALLVSASMLLGGRAAGLCYRARGLLADPHAALRTVGFVSWGGYLGMAIATAAGSQLLALPCGALLDRLLLPGLACSAIGRLGCLSYGCCGGRACPDGIVFRNPDARVVRELGAAASVPRMPTQLLSSGWALCVLLLLCWPSTRALPAGVLFALGCLLYALGRMVIEQTREEAVYSRLRLTRGHLAAAVLAVGGVAALLTIDGAPFPAVHGPRLAELGSAWPAALACGVLTLLVAGVHGRRIGQW
jgi:prolipoprotein diacylglyceryltransferase